MRPAADFNCRRGRPQRPSEAARQAIGLGAEYAIADRIDRNRANDPTLFARSSFSKSATMPLPAHVRRRKGPADAERPRGDIAGALRGERICGWKAVPPTAETLGWTVVWM
jgi:hypothetical protein